MGKRSHDCAGQAKSTTAVSTGALASAEQRSLPASLVGKVEIWGNSIRVFSKEDRRRSRDQGHLRGI